MDEELSKVLETMKEDAIKEYCAKHGIEVSNDSEIFWASVHKAICTTFLQSDTAISVAQFNKSYQWCKEHGYAPFIEITEGGKTND